MWRSLEVVNGIPVETLKPFTRELLRWPASLWSEPAECVLTEGLCWKDQAADTTLFLEVCKVVWDSLFLNDEVFWREIHPQVVAKLSTSRMFKQLANPTIQVTKGHRGRRPSEHIAEVVRRLQTKGCTHEQRFILRMAAYYHDVAKGLSVGMPRERLFEGMGRFGHPHHSFPDHETIAFLTLQRFAQDERVQRFFTLLGSQTLEKLCLIVLNHHVFEFPHHRERDEFKELFDQMPILLKNTVTAEELLLTGFFAFADMTATPEYIVFWADKVEKFQILCNEHLHLLSSQLIQLYEYLLLLGQDLVILKESGEELPSAARASTTTGTTP